MRRAVYVLLWAGFVAGCGTASAPAPILPASTVVQLVSAGDVWKLLDDGSDQGTGWRASDFDDGAWSTGPAQLGYGDGDEATVTDFGPDPADKHVTTYFRKEIDVADAARVTDIRLRLLADDGAVVYVNGVEVVRDNLPAGPIGYGTLANEAIGTSSEGVFKVFTFDPALLVAGTNVLAVEVHQADVTSSDLSFDLELDVSLGAPFVVRGPYLQRATPTGIVVRWRTLRLSASRVHFGTAPDALTLSAGSDATTTEHEVTLTGLRPDTLYHYGVGTVAGLSAGGDATHRFRTAPVPGAPRALRVWVIGDSGTANADARAVRDAYRAFAGSTPTDVWLMLGDNAYEEGTDAEYQRAVFDTYPELLKTTAVWPTIGNHDAVSSESSTALGPYFDMFTLPRAGEAGGVASGTEAYYSFDYGNAHFVCLDSQGTDRASGGAMLSWLAADLADTTAEFVIAFWHHPPFTKGSHDSDDAGDSGGRMRDMRENVLPLLEAAGVDLVLTGHSHSYERSFLLHDHHDTSDTLVPAMILDGGDGHEGGDGAYAKDGVGAVHVVAGSSGKHSGGPLDHPAMFVGLDSLGSLVVDIDGRRLDGRFLDATGAVRDRFTLLHAE